MSRPRPRRRLRAPARSGVPACTICGLPTTDSFAIHDGCALLGLGLGIARAAWPGLFPSMLRGARTVTRMLEAARAAPAGPAPAPLEPATPPPGREIRHVIDATEWRVR